MRNAITLRSKGSIFNFPSWGEVHRQRVSGWCHPASSPNLQAEDLNLACLGDTIPLNLACRLHLTSGAALLGSIGSRLPAPPPPPPPGQARSRHRSENGTVAIAIALLIRVNMLRSIIYKCNADPLDTLPLPLPKPQPTPVNPTHAHAPIPTCSHT